MDKSAAARKASARYRVKQKAIAMAEYAGAEVIDAAVIARAHDGHYVVTMYDGPALHLIERGTTPVESMQTTHEPRKLYPPKSIPAEDYAAWRAKVIEAQPTRDHLLAQLEENFRILDNPERAKKNRQLMKMVESIPDGPDWISHIPAGA